MTRMYLSLTLIISATICSCNSFPHNLQSSFNTQNSMSTNVVDVSVKGLKLTAREARRLTGHLPSQDRNIGFADVFLTIENGKQENVTLVIEKIQIQDVEDSKTQLESQTPQEIHLNPLEHSVNDFHLVNKAGYLRSPVKAVVTYRVGNLTQVIESSSVEVEQFK